MIKKNFSFRFTYRPSIFVGLLYFFIIGWFVPVYAEKDIEEATPLLQTTQFELLATKSGRLHVTIKASEMRQYENGNVALSGGVEIILFANREGQPDEKEAPTYIRANTLSYNKAEELCMIEGNVLVRKPDKELTIKTEGFWYDINQEKIFTELPIVIQDKKNVLKGDGLCATSDFTKYTVTRPNGTLDIQQEAVLGINPL